MDEILIEQQTPTEDVVTEAPKKPVKKRTPKKQVEKVEPVEQLTNDTDESKADENIPVIDIVINNPSDIKEIPITFAVAKDYVTPDEVSDMIIESVMTGKLKLITYKHAIGKTIRVNGKENMSLVVNSRNQKVWTLKFLQTGRIVDLRFEQALYIPKGIEFELNLGEGDLSFKVIYQ